MGIVMYSHFGLWQMTINRLARASLRVCLHQIWFHTNLSKNPWVEFNFFSPSNLDPHSPVLRQVCPLSYFLMCFPTLYLYMEKQNISKGEMHTHLLTTTKLNMNLKILKMDWICRSQSETKCVTLVLKVLNCEHWWHLAKSDSKTDGCYHRQAGTRLQHWGLTDKTVEKGEQEGKPHRVLCNFSRASLSQIVI